MLPEEVDTLVHSLVECIGLLEALFEIVLYGCENLEQLTVSFGTLLDFGFVVLPFADEGIDCFLPLHFYYLLGDDCCDDATKNKTNKEDCLFVHFHSFCLENLRRDCPY